MFRALIELIVTFIIAMAARAILGSVVKGFAKSARSGFQAQQQQATPEPPKQQPRERVAVAGEMHKDPVCGMYVAESTQFQKRVGSDLFYYCSGECRSKHAVTAKA